MSTHDSFTPPKSKRLAPVCISGRERGALALLGMDLGIDPSVGATQPIAEFARGAPAELLVDTAVVGVAAAHARGPRHVSEVDPLAGNRDHHARHLVDGDHFIRADVYRPVERRLHEPAHAFEALVDVEKGTRLAAIAPDLDR